MTDLNSLSKEELIKLVTQKEEQLRAAEDLAEKRERSNIKSSLAALHRWRFSSKTSTAATSLKWKST